MNFKKIVFSILAIGFFVTPILVSAADGCSISGDRLSQFSDQGLKCTTNCNYTTNMSSSNADCGTCCLLNSVYNITDWLFLIIMAVSVVMIVLGGVIFMKSGGDPTELDKAKKQILFAAVGIVVALLAKAVPSIVLSIVS